MREAFDQTLSDLLSCNRPNLSVVLASIIKKNKVAATQLTVMLLQTIFNNNFDFVVIRTEMQKQIFNERRIQIKTSFFEKYLFSTFYIMMEFSATNINCNILSKTKGGLHLSSNASTITPVDVMLLFCREESGSLILYISTAIVLLGAMAVGTMLGLTSPFLPSLHKMGPESSVYLNRMQASWFGVSVLKHRQLGCVLYLHGSR